MLYTCTLLGAASLKKDDLFDLFLVFSMYRINKIDLITLFHNLLGVLYGFWSVFILWNQASSFPLFLFFMLS